MCAWPIEAIRAMADAPPRGAAAEWVHQAFTTAGYADSLIELLAPLYKQADGVTFFDGAIRLLPLAGFARHRVPGVVEWNEREDWKQYAPGAGANAFYFFTNAFGDQFGVPLTADGSVARDRFVVLWVEKYEYEEAGIGWADALESILVDEEDTGTYFARLSEYEWAVDEFGKPEAWQCFSSKMPTILGGSDAIENVEVRAMPVHVSFTLQVIREARDANRTNKK